MPEVQRHYRGAAVEGVQIAPALRRGIRPAFVPSERARHHVFSRFGEMNEDGGSVFVYRYSLRSDGIVEASD